MRPIAAEARRLLAEFGINAPLAAGDLAVHSPIDGSPLASLVPVSVADVERAVAVAGEAFRI